MGRTAQSPLDTPFPVASATFQHSPFHTRTFSPSSTRVNVNVCRWGLDPRTAGATVSAKSFSIYWPRKGQTWATIWEKRRFTGHESPASPLEANSFRILSTESTKDEAGTREIRSKSLSGAQGLIPSTSWSSTVLLGQPPLQEPFGSRLRALMDVPLLKGKQSVMNPSGETKTPFSCFLT